MSIVFDFPTHIISTSDAINRVKNTLCVFNYTPIYDANNKNIGRKWIQIPTNEISIHEDIFELNNNFILLTLPEVDEKVIPEIGDIIIIYVLKDFFSEFHNTNDRFCCSSLNNDVSLQSIVPIMLVVENIEYTLTQQGKVKEGCIIKLGKGYDYFYLDKTKRDWFGKDKNAVPNNVKKLIEDFNEVLTESYPYLYFISYAGYDEISVVRTEKFNRGQKSTSIKDFLAYLEYTKPKSVPTFFIFSILGYKWITLDELISYTQKDLNTRKVLELNNNISTETKITKKYFSKNLKLSSFSNTIIFGNEDVNQKIVTIDSNSSYDIIWEYLTECFLSDLMEMKIESDVYLLRVGDKVRMKNNKNNYDGFIVVKSKSIIDSRGYRTKECVLSKVDLKKENETKKEDETKKNDTNTNFNPYTNFDNSNKTLEELQDLYPLG